MRPSLLALLCLLPATGRAQALPTEMARRVDAVFADFDRTDAPGCALGIYQDGQVAYARGYGMANLELGMALSPQSVLDLGSTSKQFAAFAIALLEQEGKLDRRDPVRRYVPELGRVAEGVTIEQLMQHTSGLRDYLVLMYLAGWRTEDWTDADDALAIIARQREANFAPDAEFLYSNTGYFLLAVIVERVSGESLRAFAARRIFAPLGMRTSHFHDDHAMVVAGRATGYAPRPDGGYAIEMSNYEQTGDGAVLTSVEELLRWDSNFYTGTVGGMELIARQQVPGALADGSPIGYASGLFVSTHRGRRTVSHGGAWAGYRAELLRFPDQRTAIAVLCNRADATPTRRAEAVAGVVLADVLGPADSMAAPRAPREAPVRITLPAATLAAWDGTYTSSELDATWRLQADSAGIRAMVRGRPLGTFHPTGRDTLVDAAGIVLRATRGARGAVTGFAVEAGRVRNIRFTRVP